MKQPSMTFSMIARYSPSPPAAVNSDTMAGVDKYIYYDNAIFDFLLTNLERIVSTQIKNMVSMFINHVGLLDEVFNYSNKFTFYKRLVLYKSRQIL